MSDFPNVDKYCDLDLDSHSEIGQALLDDHAAELESNSGEMRIIDLVGPTPAGMTRHMASWYQSRIDTSRKSALNEIDNALQALGDKENVSSPLAERTVDQINDSQIVDKRNAQKRHAEQNSGSYSKLEESRAEYQRAKRRYDERYKTRKREPKMIGWFYWTLIAFIGLFEAFINFEAFADLSLFTPIVALGSTVVIAILLALSSHLHGAFLAQFQHRFGAHRSDGDVAAAWRIFGLGTLGLAIVLSAVWYARANYLQDAIIEAAVIGGQPPSWLATVGGSLLMNLGVWVAGVIISFLCHDSDPEYPGAKKERDSQSKIFRQLETKLNGELEREFKRIDAVAEQNRNDAKSFDESMRHEARYLLARKQFERLSSVDAAVLGLLQQYQSSFSSRAGASGLNITREAELQAGVVETLSAAEYGALRIKLKYL